MIRYKTISQFSAESGYTEGAIRTKIRDGIWLEGRVWVKAPDGRILISTEGYNAWVETAQGFAQHRKAASKSRSPTAASVVAKGSGSSPRPPT